MLKIDACQVKLISSTFYCRYRAGLNIFCQKNEFIPHFRFQSVTKCENKFDAHRNTCRKAPGNFDRIILVEPYTVYGIRYMLNPISECWAKIRKPEIELASFMERKAKVRIGFIVSLIWKTQQSIPDPWFIFVKQKKFVKKNTQV